MKMMKFSLLLLMLFAVSLAANATGTLLISQENPYLGYGYGLSYWNGFTADLNSAFGGSGNVALTGTDLNDLSYMEQFDALMVVARQPHGQVLSSTEIANITAYIAAGHRVLLIGENDSWADWNNSILATVGGTYSGGETDSTLNRAVVNDITMNSPFLNTFTDGLAVGGTSLYDQNVVTMWGPNAVSLLSINVLEDGAGNDAFDTDLSIWLAGGSAPPTPEPATLLMLGSGAVLLAARRKR